MLVLPTYRAPAQNQPAGRDGAPLAAVRAVHVVRLGYDFEPVLEHYLFAHATLTTTS